MCLFIVMAVSLTFGFKGFELQCQCPEEKSNFKESHNAHDLLEIGTKYALACKSKACI